MNLCSVVVYIARVLYPQCVQVWCVIVCLRLILENQGEVYSVYVV